MTSEAWSRRMAESLPFTTPHDLSIFMSAFEFGIALALADAEYARRALAVMQTTLPGKELTGESEAVATFIHVNDLDLADAD